MEIHDNLVFGSLLNDALIEVRHPLVGMIHEVDLHSGDAPFGVGLEELVEILLHGKPRQPEHNLHTFSIAILDKLRQTQVVVAMEGITS